MAYGALKQVLVKAWGDRVERLSTLYSFTWVVPTARVACHYVKKKTTSQFTGNVERGIFRVANFKSTAASRGFFVGLKQSRQTFRLKNINFCQKKQLWNSLWPCLQGNAAALYVIVVQIYSISEIMFPTMESDCYMVGFDIYMTVLHGSSHWKSINSLQSKNNLAV